MALRHIEQAQRSLLYASEELSPVVGLVDEWERLGGLYDAVKQQWHAINELSGPFRLDSEKELT
jgi:hypothetical protein